MTYNYYPLLRGRQYDLLALQSCLAKPLPHVCPIIEPVKDISTLPKTLKLWLRQRSLGLILNPGVGDYPLTHAKKNGLPEKLRQHPHLFEIGLFDDSFTPALFDKSGQRGLICQNYHYLESNRHFLPDLNLDFLLLPDEARFRQLTAPLDIPQISLSDPLQRESDLTAYLDHSDEIFSLAGFLGQMRPNQIGFSDYSLMGSYYSEFGAPQKTQVLQLIYSCHPGELRIHHFVSFDDGTMGHQKEKFLDLLIQLRGFVAAAHANFRYTAALKQLLYQHELAKNPGFGTVKKLLLAHHFQLVSAMLSAAQ